ncbi:hypothetical protein HYW82_02330 [Candidatus Peregrinibacteria bacterium]|nr:hypothetical protein [Candidatus Peregrinibacteria bacterium]
MKKLLLLICASVFFAGCGGKSGLEPEALFPEDAGLVFVLDNSNEQQRDQLEEIMDRFPETGFWKKYAVPAIDENLKASEGYKLSYKKHLKPVLKGKWKLAVSIANFSVEEDMADVYVVVKSDKANKFKDLLSPQLDGEGIQYKKDGDYEYWTNVDGRFYAARYKDLFLIASNEEALEGMKARVDGGKSFADNADVKNRIASLAEGNMGYAYVNSADFADYLAAIYAEFGMGQYFENYVGAIGDSYSVWGVSDYGFFGLSEADIADNPDQLEKVMPGYTQGLNFVNKVNSDGLIAYFESYGAGVVMHAFINGILTAVYSGGDGYSQVSAEFLDLMNFVQRFLSLLDDSFAFTFSNTGGFTPSVALYFQLDEADKEEGAKLVEKFDAYIVKVLDELKNGPMGNETPVYALKKDVEIVNGGTLHKIYLDFEALAVGQSAAEFKVFENIMGKQKFEFFYGITGDNVLVLAFYPDFEEVYGKNVLANDEKFKKALGDADVVNSVTYFQVDPLLGIFGMYVNIARLSGNPDLWQAYDLYVKKIMGAIEYLIAYAYVGGDVLRSNFQMVIGEGEE